MSYHQKQSLERGRLATYQVCSCHGNARITESSGTEENLHDVREDTDEWADKTYGRSHLVLLGYKSEVIETNGNNSKSCASAGLDQSHLA